MDTTIPVLGVGAVIALAMGFNYTNGFHDAANAIATS
ncbi:MAG: inorganic phosphate transporter, partial [Dermatophilaceae bacterium]|nr:inorganic phosphate transporter [Dermatophilaceae bacterium]